MTRKEAKRAWWATEKGRALAASQTEQRRAVLRFCRTCLAPVGRGKQLCAECFTAKRKAGAAGRRLKNKAREAKSKAVWAKQNPDKRHATFLRWKRKHPSVVRANHRKYRLDRLARKRGGKVVEHVDRGVLFARAVGRCGICRLQIDPTESWHADHIVPLSKGGDHSYANTQPTHAACNIKKGNRLEFAA